MDNHHNIPTIAHSDDIQDILTAVPSWLIRWGISLFFGVFILLLTLSALIRYPDLVGAQMKIDSPNSPKPVVCKISGKLIKLLVSENEKVKPGDALAYLESTANHEKALLLLTNLKLLQQQVLHDQPLSTLPFGPDSNLQLGELQLAYQTFYEEYIAYSSSVNNGFLLKKKSYLEKDLFFLSQQQQQLKAQKIIQEKDLALAADEYDMHKKLEQQRVETRAELRLQESKFLSKKSPLLQTESAIIIGDNNYTSKEKEILELNNQLQEEKAKFIQAINSLFSNVEDWKSKYVLTASEKGKVSYAGIIQENQVLALNQNVFYINPGNKQFFGELSIPQNDMGKVHTGQQVLVRLRSYPFEEYGMIRGEITYIADVAYKDSIFIAKVNFKIRKLSDIKKPIHLKSGMIADAEIITQDATILERLARSFFRVFGNK